MPMRAALTLIPLALLAACGPKSDNGPSPEDDRQLNEAAAALDANDAAPAGQPANASAVSAADQSSDQGNSQ
jgi:hypothetical protein